MEIPQIDNSVDISTLAGYLDELKQQSLTPEQRDALDLIEDELTYQKTLRHVGLPVGFVHTDYFKDNVLFTENFVSGVIDFWFSCTDYFVYDLAIALNAWGFENGELTDELFNQFLEGYSYRRALTDGEKSALPDMLRLAALRFLTTRLYDEVAGFKKSLGAQKPFQTWCDRLMFHRQNQWDF